MACIPTSFMVPVLRAPIENSPPGIHTIPAGPFGGAVLLFSLVDSNPGSGAARPEAVFAKLVGERSNTFTWPNAGAQNIPSIARPTTAFSTEPDLLGGVCEQVAHLDFSVMRPSVKNRYVLEQKLLLGWRVGIGRAEFD